MTTIPQAPALPPLPEHIQAHINTLHACTNLGSWIEDYATAAILADRASQAALVAKAVAIGWQFRFVFPTHKSNWRNVLDLPMTIENGASADRSGPATYETRYVYALSAPPAPPQPQGPVAGWKLVPVEPTDDMIEAFHLEAGQGAFSKWDAMLAAAPSAASTTMEAKR